MSLGVSSDKLKDIRLNQLLALTSSGLIIEIYIFWFVRYDRNKVHPVMYAA